MPSGLANPPRTDITAFLGRDQVGIRYPDRVICLPCSVTLDPSDLDIELEVQPDPSQSCAACSSEI